MCGGSVCVEGGEGEVGDDGGGVTRARGVAVHLYGCCCAWACCCVGEAHCWTLCVASVALPPSAPLHTYSLDDATYATLSSLMLFNNVDVVLGLYQDAAFLPRVRGDGGMMGEWALAQCVD